MRARFVPTSAWPSTRLACLASVLVAAGLFGPAPASAQSRNRPPSTTDYLVQILPGHSAAELLRPGVAMADSIPAIALYLLRAAAPADPQLFADSLASLSAVEAATVNASQTTPEAIRQMVLGAVGGTIGDFATQSVITRLRIDDSHHLATGAGQLVAVLDTGIDFTHPAFAGRIATFGRDFVDNDYDATEVANGVDDDRDGIVDGAYGHGTMVAGLISLVAPDAIILPIRVLDDEGRGDAFKICQGIQYAVEHGVTVINMSFGATAPLPIINSQIEAAQAGNVVVVAGAGNNNSGTQLFYPAAYPTTLMVTAVDSLDIKASFADYTSRVTVSAPGTNLRSAFPGGGWALGSGCSFATPLVAGEVALLRSADPALNWNDIKGRVTLGVTPIDNLPGNIAYRGLLGSGRIDVWLTVSRSATAIIEFDADRDHGSAVRVLSCPSRGHALFAVNSSRNLPGAVIRVLDAAGRRVRSLPVDSNKGVVWDGRDAAGRISPEGVYFAELRTGAAAVRTRFVFLR